MFKEIPLHQKTDGRGSKRSLIYGVGINDAPYQTSISVNGTIYSCPYFVRWRTMLSRCYSQRWLKAHPTYTGCTVTPEWHSFKAFKEWMLSKSWQGKHLDKDLLSLGKGRYSPETCIFVSAKVNSLFLERDNAQGTHPLGIYLRKGKYEVGASRGDGKGSWVGVYATIPEAMDAYIKTKREVATLIAAAEDDPEVRQAILGYLEYFTEKYLLLKAAY